MSKERVLLKEFIDFVDSYEFYPTERNIIFEIVNRANAILAQPEQTEQEPVAWKVIDGTNGKYMFSRIKPTERSYKYDVVIPLYLAPPKREPLTPQQISEGNQSTLNVTREAFKQGVIFAEKAHGIGGE